MKEWNGSQVQSNSPVSFKLTNANKCDNQSVTTSPRQLRLEILLTAASKNCVKNHGFFAATRLVCLALFGLLGIRYQPFGIQCSTEVLRRTSDILLSDIGAFLILLASRRRRSRSVSPSHWFVSGRFLLVDRTSSHRNRCVEVRVYSPTLNGYFMAVDEGRRRRSMHCARYRQRRSFDRPRSDFALLAHLFPVAWFP